jgi:TonB-dependent receptor
MNNYSTSTPLQAIFSKCLLVLWAFLGSLSVFAQEHITQLKDKVSLQVEYTNASAILHTLQEQTTYTFTYDNTSLQQLPIKNLYFTNASLGEVLQYLKTNYGLQFSLMSNKNIGVMRGTPQAVGYGTISGKVIDEENAQPLSGISVRVGSKGTTTAIDGSFTIRLPKGKYEAEISAVGYAKKVITDIEIKEGQVFTLNITLKWQADQLADVTVTASAKKESVAALYIQQKNNPAISDGISQEQIRRTPDNNVAQVLKRVSGLTVQNDKFVTVRGMSERYNNVQLNGSALPSTEPNRRNFSFDIIPSSLIDNIVVNKTFTPDLPGEFSGGLVQINTIDVPAQSFISISAGLGFNTNSTGKNFKSTKRYNADYFGGGEQRSWYNRTWDYNAYNQVYYPQNLTEETLTKMNEVNKNIPNHWGLHNYEAQPTQIYQIGLGKLFRLKNENTVGIVAAGSYRHEETVEDFVANYRTDDSTTDGKRYTFTTALGAIGNVTWQTKKHKLVWRNLYNRRFIHNNNVQNLVSLSQSGTFYEYYSNVLINNLWQTRLEGEHQLFYGIKLTWFGDYNKVKREQPDDRFSRGRISDIDTATGKPFVTYDLNTPTMVVGGAIYNSLLSEEKENVGANFSKTFRFFEHNQQIKLGYWGTFRDAQFEQVGLRILATDLGYSSGELVGKPDYELYSQQNFANNLLYYHIAYPAGSSAGDAYTGKQNIHAGYFMADLNPLKKLRVVGGVRYEHAAMDVSTIIRLNTTDPNNPTAWKDTTIHYTEPEWLPSAAIIYSLTPRINIRATYSKTLARPDFRERSYYAYYDVVEKVTLKGNGGLTQSYTNNYDVRFEWYPGTGEVLSVSGFYKKFMKPVELVSYVGTDGNYSFFYYNLENSSVKGIEADFRKSLGFINRNSHILNNFFISGNFSWLKADVLYDPKKLADQAQNLRPDQIDSSTYGKDERNRPLQGLSPYIINAGIGYQGKIIGVNLTYNRFGRRLTVAGLKDVYDEYESPRDVLDAQISLRLLKQKLEIRLNAADLLNQHYIIYRNTAKDGRSYDDPKGMQYNPDSDWTLYKGKRGTSYSFTIAYRFD